MSHDQDVRKFRECGSDEPGQSFKEAKEMTQSSWVSIAIVMFMVGLAGAEHIWGP